MPDYLLPKFSKTAIEDYIKEKKTNANLLFYCYLRGVSNHKADEGDTTSETLKNHFIKKASPSMSKALLVRHEAFLRQWEADYGKGSVCEKPLELTSRMIVGMGIPSSFENGLLLHWTHGIPYINGEALKGAARSFAKEGHRDDNFSKEEFRSIFGTLEKEERKPENVLRGKVVFFDAFPEPVNEFFDVDIITSHYGPYYTPVDNTNDPASLPGDWHMPNPVAFLTVKEGLIFRFAVASIDETLAKRAWKWLETALICRGVGAKKHIGYGHFMPGKNIESEFDRFMTRLNNIKSQMLIGRVSELVNALEKINDTKERQKGAQELTKRIGNKKLNQKSDKEWAKQLKDFLLE